MSCIRQVVMTGILLGWTTAKCLPAAAGEPAAPAPAQPVPNNTQLLEGAMKAIQAGHVEEAVRNFLDPLTAAFEAQVKPDAPRLYSANSPEESLLYLMSAAVDGSKGQGAQGAKVLDGTWAAAFQMKGYALVELKRFDEARAVLRRGTEIAPMHPGIWNELGNLLQDEKNWPEALAAYKKAEEGAGIVYGKQGDPNKVVLTRALRGQGFVLIETGELDKAQALYERCLTINPNDAVAKNELGYIAGLRRKAQ